MILRLSRRIIMWVRLEEVGDKTDKDKRQGRSFGKFNNKNRGEFSKEQSETNHHN